MPTRKVGINTPENDCDEILIQGLMWTGGQKLEFSSMLKHGA
jgi:hypothetical protein